MFSLLLFRAGRGGGEKLHSNCTVWILCCLGLEGWGLGFFFPAFLSYSYKIHKDYLAAYCCRVLVSIVSEIALSLHTDFIAKKAGKFDGYKTA